MLVGVQLGIALPAFADPLTIPAGPPLVQGEKDPGAAISPMNKGQIAPFTGVLLSSKAVASVIAEIHANQEQIKIEVDRALGLAAAHCTYMVAETTNRLETDKKIIQAQVDEQAKENSVLAAQLKTAEANKPNMPVWVGLSIGGGFVVGVAATILVVYGVNQASKP